ncbi:glycosyl hydrolase [Cohnella sp. GbtcB17]|uniref:glycosyl hydrolase n=1 Tax=Cohnella sp. GbtcB17 TaxID=2824762 RepID=UPI001C2FC27D|nr:glycosyl hydrolase [Cohnella sp. GbtcB17]
MNKSELRQLFEQPPVAYRGVPFWSWNDRLQQDELDRQVKGFKEQGMGGFMMHVREGLETPYLSDEFMARIKDTVAMAKQEGLHAWLYDEDRYSSGMGGGAVPKLGGDDVRAKALTLEISENVAWDQTIVVVYKAVIHEDQIERFEIIRQPDLEKAIQATEKQAYLIFRREMAVPNDWCHGDTYTDNLNPRSAALFIESTYEVYKKAVGDEFGGTVPGIFTDEPSIRGFAERQVTDRAWISWTDRFPEVFLEANGYDFWSVLPYLFFLGEKSAKTRFDYWKTVAELFCEAYTKPISQWCRENGLLFSGHFHSESSLLGSVQTSGAVMPHYRFLDVPGIDTLCEQTDESLTVKQVSSVARQYGMKRVITETYGVTGWELTFESRRWIGDWQFVLGVNLLTHHLALYSLKGCRKRDYPPSFNYNSNWWPHNRVMEDYFARLGAVLSQGEAVREVLVLHPLTTVWSMLGVDVKGRGANQAGNIDQAKQFDRTFNQFTDLMLAAHYDFDLGDELILSESGDIVDGRLKVNAVSYSVVIMPPMKNMLSSTVGLLRRFLMAGGRVIAVGEMPALVDGLPSDIMASIQQLDGFVHLSNDSEVLQTLERLLPREVSIKNANGREAESFLYMLRDLDDTRILFVVNKDRLHGEEVEIELRGVGRVEQWDVLTGEVREVNAIAEGAYMKYKTKFGPADSKLYVLDLKREPTRIDKAAASPSSASPGPIITALGPASRFTRTAPNVLTLDRCRYRIGEGSWHGITDVWQAQREIRAELNMRQVFANGGLQRHLWIHEPHEKDGTPVTLEFVFEVCDSPEKDVFVVIEQANLFEITLNGDFVTEDPQEWFIDRSFLKVKLPKLKSGTNVLTIGCSYNHTLELEDCYLIGDFGVSVDRVIGQEPNRLRFGDWGLQGYLHYAGSMVYHFEYVKEAELERDESVLLELGYYRAVTVDIRVNDQFAGHVPWKAAKRLDIGKYLSLGRNRIDIEVVGSLRNMLGPLHQAGTAYDWKEWWDYRRTGLEYTPDYVTTPYGLMGQVHLYKTKEND